MKKQLKFAVSRAIDLILPPRCVFTGEIVGEQGAIMPEIWTKLQFISEPMCACCGVPFAFEMSGNARCANCLGDPPSYGRARAALIYDDVSRDLILKFKHADQTHAVISFIPWMMRAGEALLQDSDVILPVPLNRWRLFKRKYNQAALIAAALSRKSQRPWLPLALQRVRPTASQGHMKPSERAKNVKGAFAVRAKDLPRLQGKSVLLVDDVLTTGATVKECIKVLLAAGCKEVNVLTLARVVKAS